MKISDDIIKFIETLRLPDGTSAGKPFVLREWQKEILREVYDPANPDGRRMVREAVLSMARKNGKTAFVGAISICHLCGPLAVRNGQLYSLSVDREQAGILFNYVKNMIYMDEELSDQLNVIESRKQIVDPVSGSTYYVLSGEKKGKMGKSSSFIAFDELAEFGADRTLYDALLTSTGAHDEPMVWVFSTQAADDNAVLSELIDYGEKVRLGDIEDQTFKSFVYQVPADADVFDPDNWPLANPALGDFRNFDELKEFADKAKRMPSMESTLRNLYCNQRIDKNTPFISRTVFEACGADPEPLSGQSVICGLDLSSRTDLTAFIVMFSREGVWSVHCFFWTPEEGLKDRAMKDRTPYDVWVKQGLIETTPGHTVDYEWVATRMAEILSDCDVEKIMYDRWRLDILKKELDRIGVDFPLEPYGQGFKDQSPALESLLAAFLNQRIAHGNNPVLKMCCANAVVIQDPAGNKKLNKAKSTGRIDGMAALANAFGTITNEDTGPSIYETSG
ncbi:MAG: terminase large subunit, partial [Verrucomicrobiae bacterium]|nr:terminase large subunit [Verrucomicrobiae bacterium]